MSNCLSSQQTVKKRFWLWMRMMSAELLSVGSLLFLRRAWRDLGMKVSPHLLRFWLVQLRSMHASQGMLRVPVSGWVEEGDELKKSP